VARSQLAGDEPRLTRAGRRSRGSVDGVTLSRLDEICEIAGIVEIILGSWAAGGFGRKVILLVVWVGVAALIRGISEIIFAFTLKGMRGAV
jgi:uncharacterized membrane protein HdeD (DUF308 family)